MSWLALRVDRAASTYAWLGSLRTMGPALLASVMQNSIASCRTLSGYVRVPAIDSIAGTTVLTCGCQNRPHESAMSMNADNDLKAPSWSLLVSMWWIMPVNPGTSFWNGFVSTKWSTHTTTDPAARSASTFTTLGQLASARVFSKRVTSTGNCACSFSATYIAREYRIVKPADRRR